jgi:hypothetical protein
MTTKNPAQFQVGLVVPTRPTGPTSLLPILLPDRYSWVKFLPPKAREEFESELENFLAPWRSTALVYNDPKLLLKLKKPLRTLVARSLVGLARWAKKPSTVRFREMVKSGLIDEHGRVLHGRPSRTLGDLTSELEAHRRPTRATRPTTLHVLAQMLENLLKASRPSLESWPLITENLTPMMNEGSESTINAAAEILHEHDLALVMTMKRIQALIASVRPSKTKKYPRRHWKT